MNYFEKLLRPNILQLKPYSSARDEYSGEAAVFLDANENPFNSPYNRYPDPYQRVLKQKIGKIKGIDASYIFLGNGSDEPIDVLYRAFCEPGIDNVVSINPTYGMYQVAADINHVEVRRVLLTSGYQIDVPALLAAADKRSKLLFLCSPNNPTGNCLHTADIEAVLKGFNGIVVLDEAYIDFAPGKSFLHRLAEFPNLVVLQTFSKAWGMAGLRLGMAFMDPALVRVFNKIKYPYNINILTQKTALDLLDHSVQMQKWVDELLASREKLAAELAKLPFVVHIYPSDSNFLLIKAHGARHIYQYLVDKQIIVRDRSSVALCEGCLRITVGSADENMQLMEALNQYQN
ncbi:MAG: histidinol-phosphate transaminase [Breznakibacter sp.]